MCFKNQIDFYGDFEKQKTCSCKDEYKIITELKEQNCNLTNFWLNWLINVILFFIWILLILLFFMFDCFKYCFNYISYFFDRNYEARSSFV